MKVVRLVIFTDLDGTLLSHESYSAGPAAETLRRCEKEGIPVIFVSSKTRAEIEKLRFELEHGDPFISENGGGIFLPTTFREKPPGFEKRGDYWTLALGTPHESLVIALHDAAKKCRVQLETFSTISLDRLIEFTGLTEEEARFARMREFDEPFLIKEKGEAGLLCLTNELHSKGYNISKGGRFYHITGGVDKGTAIRRVMDLYRYHYPHVRFGAVGDAENDLPMLQEVDYPFLVRKPDGRFEEAAAPVQVTVTEGIGPQGFTEAVEFMITHS